MGVKLERARHSLAPWAGLFAGAFAWLAHHQILSDGLHYDCYENPPLGFSIGGLLALALIAAGAWISWQARQAEISPERNDPTTRRFAADVSLLGAALFSLPVLLQTIAGFIVPVCPP